MLWFPGSDERRSADSPQYRPPANSVHLLWFLRCSSSHRCYFFAHWQRCRDEKFSSTKYFHRGTRYLSPPVGGIRRLLLYGTFNRPRILGTNRRCVFSLHLYSFACDDWRRLRKTWLSSTRSSRPRPKTWSLLNSCEIGFCLFLWVECCSQGQAKTEIAMRM